MKAAALLTGINYVSGDPRNRLRGCCNDVRAMAKALGEHVPGIVCTVMTDEDPRTAQGTTLRGMLRNLQALCVASWRDDLDLAFIQFSGHGTQVRDQGGEEVDGLDEVVVPSDVATAGFLVDDDLAACLALFNPRTLVCCVMDCCHSGSMLDLPYTYAPGSDAASSSNIKAMPRIMCLSGCKDDQTSADAPDAETRENRGALTAALLRELARSGGGARKPVLDMQRAIAADLGMRGFRQVPLLTANFDLRDHLFLA